MVKRYEPCCHCDEEYGGNYVHYDDYAALEARVAELGVAEKEREALRRCAIKYLGWLLTSKELAPEDALRRDMQNPEVCGDAAITQCVSREA